MLINFFLSVHKYLFLIHFKATTTTTNWTPDGPGAFTNVFSHLLQNSAPVSLNFLDLLLEDSILFSCLRIRLLVGLTPDFKQLWGQREWPQLQEAAAPEITRSRPPADKQETRSFTVQGHPFCQSLINSRCTCCLQCELR